MKQNSCYLLLSSLSPTRRYSYALTPELQSTQRSKQHTQQTAASAKQSGHPLNWMSDLQRHFSSSAASVQIVSFRISNNKPSLWSSQYRVKWISQWGVDCIEEFIRIFSLSNTLSGERGDHSALARLNQTMEASVQLFIPYAKWTRRIYAIVWSYCNGKMQFLLM